MASDSGSRLVSRRSLTEPSAGSGVLRSIAPIHFSSNCCFGQASPDLRRDGCGSYRISVFTLGAIRQSDAKHRVLFELHGEGFAI